MKNIYIIVLFFFALGFTSSCENDLDSNPVYRTPDSFVLNVPKYASTIYDLKNTGSIELTWSQPDYGFTAATVYSVEVSVKENFETYSTLSGTSTVAKVEVDAKELATLLVGLLGVETEEDYPTELFPVYVRVKAQLANGLGSQTDQGVVLSNPITLPRVKGYFALDPLKLPANMYIIGNVNGWSWTAATTMVPVNGAADKFWAIQYLGQVDGANAQIKFNSTLDWTDTAFGFENTTIDDASVALAGTVDNGGNIEITNPGWYIVVVTVAIDGRSYKNMVEFLPPNVYLQGKATAAGNWSDSPSNLFTVPDISLGADAEFVSPAFATNVTTADDGIRATVILPLMAAGDSWKTEFIVLGGKLEYRGNGGDQDRVSGNVGQKLYINFTKKTGKIE